MVNGMKVSEVNGETQLSTATMDRIDCFLSHYGF